MALRCGCAGTDTKIVALTKTIEACEALTGPDGIEAGTGFPDDIWQHDPLCSAGAMRSPLAHCAIIGQSAGHFRPESCPVAGVQPAASTAVGHARAATTRINATNFEVPAMNRYLCYG